MSFSPVMPDGDTLLRIKEVARFLRSSDKTVRRMIEAGQLHSFKVRGLRLVRWSDVQRLVSQASK